MRCAVGLLCDAHKKAAAATLGFKILAPLDTKIVRLGLSVQGPVMQAIRREARKMIAEQLVIVKSGECPIEAVKHRHAIYELFIAST